MFNGVTNDRHEFVFTPTYKPLRRQMFKRRGGFGFFARPSPIGSFQEGVFILVLWTRITGPSPSDPARFEATRWTVVLEAAQSCNIRKSDHISGGRSGKPRGDCAIQSSWVPESGPIRREWLDASSLWSPFRYRLGLNGESQCNDPAVLCPFNRTEFDLQVGLRVDLQNRDIERPLLEVCPDGQGRFLNDISFRVLDRLQVRKDFHPRSDPIQGGKLELFVQVFFLFFLYGSDNAKKSVGLVADPGREIKPIIKKVESPKSVEI